MVLLYKGHLLQPPQRKNAPNIVRKSQGIEKGQNVHQPSVTTIICPTFNGKAVVYNSASAPSYT